MPLSKAAPRKHIHTRDIQCRGFQREDGLWDIEGELIDAKTYDFANHDRDGVSAGEPIHHMRVRLTVTDGLEVVEAEAITESGPFTLCGDIAPVFEKLAGLTIGPGWRREVKQIMGGIHGCTHLTDMILGPVAVTAFQTVIPARARRGKPVGGGRPPRLINSCHAFREDGPIVEREWPNHHRKPSSPSPGG